MSMLVNYVQPVHFHSFEVSESKFVLCWIDPRGVEGVPRGGKGIRRGDIRTNREIFKDILFRNHLPRKSCTFSESSIR